VNRKILLHAVVRHDADAKEIALAFTVVAVVPTKEEAEREVARLNGVKADQPSTYFWTPANYYPDGRGSQTD
jgi:hypothetical protein